MVQKIRSIFSSAILCAMLCSCDNAATHSASTATGNQPDRPAAVRNTERGKEIFQERCIACHGMDGNYKNNNAANLQLSRIDSLTIVTTIINGKGAMPMFDHVLPDADLEQLELYVMSLRK